MKMWKEQREIKIQKTK